MNKMQPSVSKVWFGRKTCNSCQGKLTKHGFTSNGKARFKCSNCNKTKVEYYTNNAYKPDTNNITLSFLQKKA